MDVIMLHNYFPRPKHPAQLCGAITSPGNKAASRGEQISFPQWEREEETGCDSFGSTYLLGPHPPVNSFTPNHWRQTKNIIELVL